LVIDSEVFGDVGYEGAEGGLQGVGIEFAEHPVAARFGVAGWAVEGPPTVPAGRVGWVADDPDPARCGVPTQQADAGGGPGGQLCCDGMEGAVAGEQSGVRPDQRLERSVVAEVEAGAVDELPGGGVQPG